jgi:WD40 repeat protein
MKFIAFFGLIILPLSILAQNTDCLRMMRQADSLAAIKDFEKAVNKYRAAETCDRLLQQQVDLKIKEVFVAINKEKEAAIRNEKEAIKQKNIANQKTLDEKKAREFAEEETKIKDLNEKKAIAGKLAAKAREVWASEHDSITALRLADEAIKALTPPTLEAIESFRDIATAAFTQPVRSINLIKRYVHPKSDIGFLSNSNSYPFSSSLKYFITKSVKDKSIRIWQLSNGQNIYKFDKYNQSIYDLVFSQNDEYLMMISYGGKVTEDILDLASGKLLVSYPDTLGSSIKKAFFVNNKPMLFYESDSLFKVLDISNQSIVKTIPQIKGLYLSYFQSSLNGNRIILGGNVTEYGMVPKKLIKIWDLEKNIFYNEIKTNEIYGAFNISKDIRFLAVDNMANSIDIIDLESNQVVKTLVGHNSKITNLVFSDDSKFLISGDNTGQVKFWNIEWGISVQTFNIQTKQDLAYHIAISSDNKNIFTFSLASVNVWRTVVDILDKKNSPTLTEEERQGYGVPDWIKD